MPGVTQASAQLRVRPAACIVPQPSVRNMQHAMGALRPMPSLSFDADLLAPWGQTWLGTAPPAAPPSKTRAKPRKGTKRAKAQKKPKPKNPECFSRKQSMDFGLIFDRAFGEALAVMLGNVSVLKPDARSLLPPAPDCVEVGTSRIVGGIRPQNFDAAYRPDGPRVVFDSKTLNDTKSVGKNWQNMVNDLATEASTVHTRFPMCIVAFVVVIPRPALEPGQERDIIRTLERLGNRQNELDQNHLAEGLSLVVWDPTDGSIDPAVPPQNSALRLENMHQRIYQAYLDRYKNLPPHQESNPDETGTDYSAG